MLERIIGTITFKPGIYRITSIDKNALEQAGILVMVVALLQNLFGVLKMAGEIGTRNGLHETVLSMFLNVILGLVVWLVIAGLLTVIARALGGVTNIDQMLRVTGFVQVFGLLSIFTLLSLAVPGLVFLDTLLVLVIGALSFTGCFVAGRAVAGLSSGRSLLAAFLVLISSWVVILLLDLMSGVLLPDLIWYIHFFV